MEIKLKSKSFILILSALFFSASAAFSQKTIKGVVKDASNNETLIGAIILILGTSSGTITDLDGAFTLDVASTQISRN